MKNEHVVKEKLYNHTLPVREGLWESIESRLPPEDNARRAPFFWLVLFTAALAGGIMISGLLQHKSESIPNETESSSHPTPNTTSPQTAISENNGTLNTASSEETAKQDKRSNHFFAGAKSKTSKSSGSISPSADIENQNVIKGESEQASPVFEYSSSASMRQSGITEFLPIQEMNEIPQDKTEMNIAAIPPDPSCYKFGPTGMQYAFSADLFAGPGFSPRSFNETGGESPIYADAREATEHFQYAWSAGGRLNLQLRNGLAARLGILYEQTGYIFDYTDTLATQSTTRVDSFFASDGTFLYADTSRILIFGTLIKKIHNTYRTLDIPLLLSYELPMGRSMLMFNVGPVFNLTTTQEGQILDPLLHPRYITEGASNQLQAYKTDLGVNLYIGAGVLFPISDNISGLVEPRFLYRFNPVTVESYPLEEHRHHVGLNLGIRYHFN